MQLIVSKSLQLTAVSDCWRLFFCWAYLQTLPSKNTCVHIHRHTHTHTGKQKSRNWSRKMGRKAANNTRGVHWSKRLSKCPFLPGGCGHQNHLQCFVKTKATHAPLHTYRMRILHARVVPRNVICSKASWVFLIHNPWLRITGFDDS